MEIKNIIFYSHEKNGDCFVNKGYVKYIMEKFPDINFSYVHDHHPSIVQDLNCRVVRTFQIPAEINKNKKSIFHEDSGTLFINTWIGAWIGKYLVHGQHANFPLIHRAWSEFLQVLELPIEGDYDFYLPEINYSAFDLSKADQYLEKVKGKKLILICNGIQQSGQSAMGVMTNTIHMVASHFNDYEFLSTYRVNVDLPNVTYTDDVFGSDIGYLNQISYIGQEAKMIIGKNSGPFTFCHTKQMVNDPEKIFLSFNFRMIDCLLGAGIYNCNSFYSSTIDEMKAGNIIIDLLNKKDFYKNKKAIIQMEI